VLLSIVEERRVWSAWLRRRSARVGRGTPGLAMGETAVITGIDGKHWSAAAACPTGENVTGPLPADADEIWNPMTEADGGRRGCGRAGGGAEQQHVTSPGPLWEKEATTMKIKEAATSAHQSAKSLR